MVEREGLKVKNREDDDGKLEPRMQTDKQLPSHEASSSCAVLLLYTGVTRSPWTLFLTSSVR